MYSLTQVMDRMVSNWEGKPLCVPYDELPRFLDQPSWVPSGKAHVMAWLAIGAPNGGRAPKFAGLSANQLFDLLVKQQLSVRDTQPWNDQIHRGTKPTKIPLPLSYNENSKL